MSMTPRETGRSVKGAPDTTRPAKLDTATPRTPTHAVQGPATWGDADNRTVSTPAGPPPLHGTGAADVKPREQP